MPCWPCCPEEDELSLTSFKRPTRAVQGGDQRESFLEVDAEGATAEEHDVFDQIRR